jgi:hypothetical protein
MISNAHARAAASKRHKGASGRRRERPDGKCQFDVDESWLLAQSEREIGKPDLERDHDKREKLERSSVS